MIIPNIWKVIKFHGSKPPTSRGVIYYLYAGINGFTQSLTPGSTVGSCWITGDATSGNRGK